ncbi:hypothetical protein CK203_056260 [Vitis vinifera]|uniref:Uncharacterized protein n=1 Tax=Vitis vinifera TaxID=29760 RepID=A0A438GJM3_VITVI|nr:hypothetical protein CK203_056260 [Vitis vinifera]
MIMWIGAFRSCATKEGFSQKWRSWIRGCLSSSSFAILVNGMQRDHTIFFSKASMEHLQNLKIILLVFGQVSGLKIQLRKKHHFRPSTGREPKTIGFWDPVVERISRRKGRKNHLIRWDVVSRPKELGGLGFGKTSLRNIALLGKWLWRFPRERSGLWHKWWAMGKEFAFWEDLLVRLVKSLKSYLVPSGQVFVEFKSPSKVKALAWLGEFIKRQDTLANLLPYFDMDGVAREKQ